MENLLALRPSTVFLRREALSLGYCDSDLRHARVQGHVRRIRHGAYVSASMWADASEASRHLLLADAVVLTHKAPLALSHISAAIAHGFETYQQDLSKVHVLCMDHAIGRSHADVVYHQGEPRSSDNMLMVSDRLVVPPTRAALEAASLTDVQRGLVVLDSALNLGATSVGQLIDEYARLEGKRGTQSVRVAVRLAREGSESVGETLGRYLMWRYHIPEPDLQVEVRDDEGALVGRLDWAWPKYGLCGEFDGRDKYLRYLREGESIADAVMREKAREDLVREITGMRMIRLVWRDLDPRNAESTAARIRRSLLASKSLAS